MSFSSENNSFSSSDLSIEFPSMELGGEKKTEGIRISDNDKNASNDKSNTTSIYEDNNFINTAQQERITVLEEALCTAQTRARLTDGQLDRIKARLSSLIEDLKVRIQEEKQTATELRQSIEQIKSTSSQDNNNSNCNKCDDDTDNNNNNNEESKLTALKQYDQLMDRVVDWLENFENQNSSSSVYALTEMIALLRQANSYQYLIAIASHSQPHQSFSASSPPSHIQHKSTYNDETDYSEPFSSASSSSSSIYCRQREENAKTTVKDNKAQKSSDDMFLDSLSSRQSLWDMGFIEMLDWLAQSLLSGLITLLRVGTEWMSSVIYGKPSQEEHLEEEEDISDTRRTSTTTSGFLEWFLNFL